MHATVRFFCNCKQYISECIQADEWKKCPQRDLWMLCKTLSHVNMIEMFFMFVYYVIDMSLFDTVNTQQCCVLFLSYLYEKLFNRK